MVPASRHRDRPPSLDETNTPSQNAGHARVAKLADAPGLGPGGATREGSTPSSRTPSFSFPRSRRAGPGVAAPSAVKKPLGAQRADFGARDRADCPESCTTRRRHRRTAQRRKPFPGKRLARDSRCASLVARALLSLGRASALRTASIASDRAGRLLGRRRAARFRAPVFSRVDFDRGAVSLLAAPSAPGTRTPIRPGSASPLPATLAVRRTYSG